MEFAFEDGLFDDEDENKHERRKRKESAPYVPKIRTVKVSI